MFALNEKMSNVAIVSVTTSVAMNVYKIYAVNYTKSAFNLIL